MPSRLHRLLSLALPVLLIGVALVTTGGGFPS